jgi:hypothetical protein
LTSAGLVAACIDFARLENGFGVVMVRTVRRTHYKEQRVFRQQWVRRQRLASQGRKLRDIAGWQGVKSAEEFRTAGIACAVLRRQPRDRRMQARPIAAFVRRPDLRAAPATTHRR